MEKINYSQLGKSLVEKHPDLARKLIESSRPAFNNFQLIPQIREIYDRYIDPPATTKDRTYYRLVFIAIIVRLYDPEALASRKKYMRAGLRKHLAETLQLSKGRISNLFQMVRDYTSIYPSFVRKVGYFYNKIEQHVFGEKKETE